jgi:putative peptidoglycan lipid II flippase
VFVLITLVLVGAAPWWVPWTVPGFDAGARDLAVSLARIHCLGLALMVIVAVLTAGHHLREQFIRVEAYGAVTLLALVAGLPAALERYGVAAAAWLQVLRLLLLGALLALALPWAGARLSRDPVRRAWQRLRPLVGGTAIVKLGPLLDRWLASFAPAGSLSLLNLAQQGHVALLQVADRSVAARLTRASLGDAATFGATRDAYRRHLRLALVGGIPFAVLVTLAVVAAALALVRLGWAAPANAQLFVGVMLALAAMPVGGFAGQLAAGVLYAQGATDTVTRVALRGFALSCGVKVVAFWLWGIFGLAFGIAFYQLINAVLLHNAVMRRLRETP